MAEIKQCSIKLISAFPVVYTLKYIMIKLGRNRTHYEPRCYYVHTFIPIFECYDYVFHLRCKLFISNCEESHCLNKYSIVFKIFALFRFSDLEKKLSKI